MTATLAAAAKGTTVVKCGCRPKGVVLGEYQGDEFYRKAGTAYFEKGRVVCPECGTSHRIDVSVYRKALVVLVNAAMLGLIPAPSDPVAVA